MAIADSVLRRYGFNPNDFKYIDVMQKATRATGKITDFETADGYLNTKHEAAILLAVSNNDWKTTGALVRELKRKLPEKADMYNKIEANILQKGTVKVSDIEDAIEDDLYENTKTNQYFVVFKEIKNCNSDGVSNTYRDASVRPVSTTTPVKRSTGTVHKCRDLTSEGRVVYNYLINPENNIAKEALIKLGNQIYKWHSADKNLAEYKKCVEFNNSVVAVYSDIDNLLVSKNLSAR